MQRYFIELAYNGKTFNGWQVQNNAPTVQQLVNDALRTLFRVPLNVVGCGRTDTGVHAKQFYAHFDLEKKHSPDELEKLVGKLNGILPVDISVYRLLPVKPQAHARFDAISRTYIYQVLTYKNPFEENFAYHYPYGKLDMAVMNEAAAILQSYTDFTSFSKLHTQVKTNNCKIEKAIWKQQNDMLAFTITADRFLRNMVRAIVGTLIDVGRGKTSPEEFIEIIESKNRSNAGYSVPAKGLYLCEVTYPDEIFL